MIPTIPLEYTSTHPTNRTDITCSARTDFVFECGTDSLDFVSQYKYLGVMLNEHFDLSVMVKAVAKSASRALGLLIAKDKAFGGICLTHVFKNVMTH